MTRRIALLLSCLVLAGAALADESVLSRSLIVGGNVDVSQPAEGPVHLVGGTVTIEAPVEGNVSAAGGRIDLASGGAISGDASFAGGVVHVNGAVKGDLRAAGGLVTIDSAVGGDVSAAAGTLELGPHARIAGKLTYRGDELKRDPAAQVTGGVEHRRGGSHRNWQHRHERTLTERFTHDWFWIVGLMVLAALIAGALPGISQRMAQELRERPWLTPLLGLVALTTIPIAAVLLMLTVIGIPIGLLAIIGYAALLLIGYVWLAVVVGGMLLDRVRPETAALTAWRVGAAAVAMLVLAILARVPFIGGLVGFVALVVGVGMIVTVIFRKSTAGETQTA